MKHQRPPSRVEVAERFIALRRSALLSQQMLSDTIDVCRPSISEIENCRVRLWPATWERFTRIESRYRDSGVDLHARWHEWRRTHRKRR